MATLEKGFWVAMTVGKGAAPLKSYVGQIQEVDEHGVRLTLIDWITGAACEYDLYAPWDKIGCCLVATPDHDIKGFAEHGANWQDRIALNERFNSNGYTYCDLCLKDTRRVTKDQDGAMVCNECYGKEC